MSVPVEIGDFDITVVIGKRWEPRLFPLRPGSFSVAEKNHWRSRLFSRGTMHDVQVTIAVHIGNAETFPPLSRCGQACVETGKAQCRGGYCSRAVPLDRAR